MRVARSSIWADGRGWAAVAAGLLTAAFACDAVAAADLVVRVRQADGKPLHGAVVTVHSLGSAAATAAPIEAVMDQLDLAFAPDLLVVPVGSKVSFPNTDKVSHEVYSFSPTHRFKLGLYRGKAHAPELFDTAGLVTLGCNIHDAMLAYIVVTDGAYYGMTSADGSWTQPEVARGRYRIDVWSPRLQEPGQTLHRELVVNAGDHAVAELQTEHALRAAQLQKRPHSWDAY